MNTERKRRFRLAATLVGAGMLLGAGGLALRSVARVPISDLGPPTEEARARIDQALAAEARALEPAAVEAAHVPELTAALDMGADRTTYQDLLDNEDWWARTRSRFPLSALIGDGPLAIVGPGTADLAKSAVVRAAREHGVASGILPGIGRGFAAAAAAVPQAKRRGGPAVVLVGVLVDGAALKRVSDLTGDAVGLSDGKKLIEAGGPGEPGRAFAALVGYEDSGPRPLGDGRVGAAWPIGGGLWLLGAFRSPPPPKRPVNLGLLLTVAGVVMAALGMIVAVSRRTKGTPGWSGNRPREFGPPPAPDRHLPKATPDFGARPRGPVPLPPSVSDFPEVPPAHPQGNLSVASMPLAVPDVPTRLGRYELIERIGEGGMAEIFFAAARGAEDFVRHFVVKRMHPHLARRREAVNQFIDEARLQAALVHSNIVPVFDFGKAEGEYFLALEYIHGKDVGQVVQRHVEQFGGPLDLELAFYIVHDVLDALSYAHCQTAKDGTPLDIVHRDVAPGNVLVSYRGEVKLTDFGIAKADKRVSRTEVGMVKGNASFMSPEQARGEVVDQRSDIFSAGLVLFYCLTGDLIYRGETTLNRLLRAAVGPATSQFGHIDQLPLPAAKVLRRALAIDPTKRYANAVEFARDLVANMGDRSKLAQMMDVLFPTTLRRDLR